MRVRISWIFFRQAKNRLKNWTEINIFETVCILPTSTLTTPSANLQYSWSLHRTVKWNEENTVLWEDLKRFPSSTLKIELNYYFFHNCITRDPWATWFSVQKKYTQITIYPMGSVRPLLFTKSRDSLNRIELTI